MNDVLDIPQRLARLAGAREVEREVEFFEVVGVFVISVDCLCDLGPSRQDGDLVEGGWKVFLLKKWSWL